MTGFGKGEVNFASGKFEAEIHSLNRKHFELSVFLPKSFLALEPEIRKVIAKVISRGRVTLQVNFETSARVSGEIEVNKELAKKYHRTYLHLKNELGLEGKVSLEQIIQSQDVVKFIPQKISVKDVHPLIVRAVEQALKELLKMRAIEGKSLYREISSRLKLIKAAAKRIEKTVPRTVEEYEKNLLEKVKTADPAAKKNEDLIMKEIAIFADRIDVTEELTRLESHLSQFHELLAKPEPVGRTLDFIIQEMHREVNTIGSKANSAEVSKDVVFLKSEIEKIREQVQNVE